MRNEHFLTAPSWTAAAAMLAFQPRVLGDTRKYRLQALRIYARDHRLRELAVTDRVLEAHYGAFVFSQARVSVAEARRQALAVSYGASGREAQVGGHEARLYELGAEPASDDGDGRSPAVVAWAEKEMFYLLASGELSAAELLEIANALSA